MRYLTTGTHAGQTAPNSPVLIRYADDLIALCHSQDQAAVRQLGERLAAEVKAPNGSNGTAVISKLNPIIRGWSAYYRNAVSSHTFSALDNHVWRLTYRWAVRTHPNKPKTWVVNRHFGKFHPARQDHWTFGDRHSGRYLQKSPGPRSSATSWSRVGRHPMTHPWPTTGPGGDADNTSPWGSPTWACSRRSRGAAPLPGDCCCTPSTSRKLHTTGSNGSPPPARRSNDTP